VRYRDQGRRACVRGEGLQHRCLRLRRRGDAGKGVEPKQFHDVVGYYNQFDIFNLTIDRTPLEPAHFVDAPAADSATPDHARPNQLENGELSLRDVDGFGALS
jgi:hypothetical protein